MIIVSRQKGHECGRNLPADFACGYVRRDGPAFEAVTTASHSRMSQRGRVADWPAAGVPARHPVTTVTWVDRSDSV